uniref:Uncharacterized protein n=2 Tax=Picea TaxID=3328 RepID=A0A101M3Y5_PICGL|nr:hypothetical protein ABT39_MTgene347 [Picea glauca]QHR90148.1 hypothetical protein Q903MT_gene4171 [Picea sitchensis]
MIMINDRNDLPEWCPGRELREMALEALDPEIEVCYDPAENML